jgi:Peptidase family M48
MVRYVIAAVLACVYVAGSVWIVRRAGEQYRAGLHRTGRPAPEREPDAHSHSATSISGPPVAAADVAPRSSNPHSTDTAAHPVARPSISAATDPPQTVPPSVAVAKAQPAIVSLKKEADAGPRPEAAPVDPLANDPFWNQPELTKQWDVSQLTLDDERQLRDILHSVVIHFNPLVADPSRWLDRLDAAAEPFRKRFQRREIQYNFFILDSDVVNAFSIPGGNIYISRGLFNLIGEDEDYALEFVVGHEIAHVDLEHAVECLKMKGMKELPRGTMRKLYLLILPFGYMANDKINQEFAADEWVINKMTQNRRTRRETLALLQKLEGYSRDHGFYTGRKAPPPGNKLSPADNHYRAQVSARERLKHAKEFIAQFAAAPK